MAAVVAASAAQARPVAGMSYLGVTYAAIVLLRGRSWLLATSKTRRQERQLLLAVMLLLLLQEAVVLLAAVVVLPVPGAR